MQIVGTLSFITIRQQQYLRIMKHNNGHSFYSHSEILIAYDNLNSLHNINHPSPHQVTKLSIIHCKLDSLAGIQKFTQITHLNLKFNHLQIADEVLRIPNRAILRQLNLEGNCIQYYASCTFFALKKNGFDSLVILNNKDYSKWYKRKQKPANIQKINTKLAQMEKSMSKTLKRTIKNNVIQKYKLSNQLEPQEDLQEQEPTSRETSKNYTGSSQQRTPFRQISLSNVNMRKSVKPGQSPQEKSKMPQLFIDPIEFINDDQIIHMPLTQPTATFASQKQKQSMPFKGKTYFPHEINVVSEVDDNFTYEDDEDVYEISYYTNNGTRQSCSRSRQIYGIGNKSALQEMYESANDRELSLVEGYYQQNLLLKAWRVLKIYRALNLPRKVPYV